MARSRSRDHREESSPAKLAPGWAHLGLSLLPANPSVKNMSGLGSVGGEGAEGLALTFSPSILLRSNRAAWFLHLLLLFLSEFL